MTTAGGQRDPVEQLAEEFATRLRRGERPSVSEYVDRYPNLAANIRDLFPALVVMEQFGSVADPGTAHLGPTTGPVPETLGDYRLLREVGRGGMGVVYEAVQESLGRHVALKVLPDGPRRRSATLERFRREAKAAARLHHTNIVPVFGVGEADGVYYYAMQFIHGQGLDAVLAQVRELRAPETPRPESARGALPRNVNEDSGRGDTAASDSSTHSTLIGQPEERYCREVARLSVQAAEALHYAHGQGVLHRDVKPSNLLLDTQGTLWVTDFGLAKADDSADLTGTGDLIGTLRYMASERFRGQADARADVYSLGVTLYEMLTLRPPYDEADRLRLVRRIERGEPTRPRQIDARIPRDLETVVLKALAPDAADRYATAGQLADDLQCFLADRPIRARRHSARERAWRWCRRNPGWATTVGTLVVVVAGALAGLTALWLRADRLHQQADANFGEAQANFRLALGAVEQFCTNVGQDRRLQEQDLRALRQRLLRSAVDFYQSFVTERRDDPHLQAELAKANFRLGYLTTELDQLPQAIAFCESATAILDPLIAADPSNIDHQRSRASCRQLLGVLLARSGRPAEAEAALNDAIAAHRQMVGATTENAVDRSHLAEDLDQLSRLFVANRRPQDAEAPAREAIAIGQRLAEEFPTVAEYRRALIHSHSALGDLYRLYFNLRRLGDAEQAYRAGLSEQQRLVELEPYAVNTIASGATLRRALGNVYLRSGRLGEAEPMFDAAALIMEAVVREHGSVGQYRRELAESYAGLADIHRRSSRLPRAEEFWRKSLALRERLVEEDRANEMNLTMLGRCRQELALVVDTRGRRDEALELLDRAVQPLDEALARNPQAGLAGTTLANVLADRAQFRTRLGRHDEALLDWDRSLALNGQPVLVPRHRIERAAALARAGRVTEALANSETLIRELGNDRFYGAFCRLNAAAVYALAGQAALKDAAPTESDRGRQAETYAAHAVELLRQAVERGCKRSDIETDSDLESLRSRPDFQKVLAEAGMSLS
jgi:serine/threonine protein kinase/tetratricopeptide (TPR) repeat protein